MFEELRDLVPKDKDMPARAWRMQWLEEFRTGKIYDRLTHPFHKEKELSGVYIPLCKRRPSIRYGLPTIIVNDTVSLVFGEEHFPSVECVGANEGENKEAAKKLDGALLSFIKSARLQEVMLDAATRGSKGSIALLFRLLKSRPFVSVMDTKNLTPEWDPEEPDRLLRVTEKYKVKGRDLKDVGYAILDIHLDEEFWFQRVWTETKEEWYEPWLVDKSKAKTGSKVNIEPKIDTGKTKTHGFGFTPVVWVRNLPGGDDVDGNSTFEAALHNALEIDYQLSQAGRGLKYNSDPTLVLREAGMDMDGGFEPIVRSGSNALRIGPNDEAQLLELSGTASAAVLEFVRFIREISMELCGGNRSSPEKLSGAQSGKAMELMNQGLIWLASKLRTSYGEHGLLALIKMLIAVNKTFAVKLGDDEFGPGKLASGSVVAVGLKWPDFYKPTSTDLQAKAMGLVSYVEGRIISEETATRAVSTDFDIEDVPAERAKVDAEGKAKADMAAQVAAKTAQPGTTPKQPAKAA